jgi:putative ubiquitin-RnfH superfamily antitoxin RatB of RatAB toxin-antitoxin module
MAVMLKVELAFSVTPQEVELIALSVSEGTTLAGAIEQSGIRRRYPGLYIGGDNTGIFGRLCSGDTVLSAGDRIEIYQPLRADPKDARRLRARRQETARK